MPDALTILLIDLALVAFSYWAGFSAAKRLPKDGAA